MDYFNVKTVTDEIYRWWGAKIPSPTRDENTIIPPSTPLFIEQPHPMKLNLTPPISPVKYLQDHPYFNEDEDLQFHLEVPTPHKELSHSTIEIFDDSNDSVVPPPPEEYDDIHKLTEEFQTDDDSTFEAFASGSPNNDSEFNKCVREVIIDSINDVVHQCTKTLEEQQSEEELDQELDNYLQHLDQHLDNNNRPEDISTDDSLPAVPAWMLGLDKNYTKKRGISDVEGCGYEQPVDDVKRIKLDDEELNTYVNNSFCVDSATDVSHSTCAFVDDITEEFEPECTSSMIDPEESYDEEDWPAEEGSDGEEEYESEVNDETLLKRKRKPINFYYESSIGSYNTSDENLYESEDDVSMCLC